MPHSVLVSANSRLHFGLTNLGNNPDSTLPHFGGAGVMIDKPGLQIRVSRSNAVELIGHDLRHKRIRECLTRIATGLELGEVPQCKIEILSCPDEHIGLGVGTQLDIAIASSIVRLFELEDIPRRRYAEILDRGKRSAVGTHGFFLGGLLFDRGKRPSETLGKLAQWTAIPDDWRFLLLTPADVGEGLSGEAEKKAFAELPPVPDATTSTMVNIIHQYLIPKAQSADFASFANALYNYGEMAGNCFATVQTGGPFRTQRIADLVQTVRDMGILGVAQTSWGPTIFAVMECQREADEFATRFQQLDKWSDVKLTIAKPANSGAEITVT